MGRGRPLVTAPYHQEGGATIYHANALEVLRTLADPGQRA